MSNEKEELERKLKQLNYLAATSYNPWSRTGYYIARARIKKQLEELEK